jgi:TrmH family RNA methyltransferase
MTAAVTSEKNPLLKEVRRAASRGELTRAAAGGDLTNAGCVVAEGVHLLEEALNSPVEIVTVILAETAPQIGPLLHRAAHARIVSLSDAVFHKIATTEHPQGVITLVRAPRWTPEDLLSGMPLLTVLDGIQDPGNAGAIVRVAEAFGATGAVFLKGTVSPHNPKCLRGSAGSLFRLPVTDTFDPAGLKLYAAMPRADLSLDQADFTAPCAILIGSEAHGVRPEWTGRATGVRIPTSRVESLNAAVAAGVMLYEAHRQRSAQRTSPGPKS